MTNHQEKPQTHTFNELESALFLKNLLKQLTILQNSFYIIF